MTRPNFVTSRRAFSGPAMCAVLVLALTAGCARPPSPGLAGVTPAQRAACRQRVEEVYLQQNRGEVYRTDNYVSGSRDTPFSTSAQPNYSSGLGAEYGREQALDDCLKSSGTSVNAVQPGPAITP